MKDHTLIIWWFGYRQLLRNPWFWMGTLLVVVVLGIVGLISWQEMQPLARAQLRLGLVPPAESLHNWTELLRETLPPAIAKPMRVFRNIPAMRRAMDEHTLDLGIVVREQKGDVQFEVWVQPAMAGQAIAARVRSWLHAAYVYAVVRSERLSQRLADRLLQTPPIRWTRYHGGVQIERWRGYVVPYVILFLFFYPTIMAASFIAYEISADKESRLYEVLLTTARPSQIMAAKILVGMAGGLTQLVIWIGLALGGVLGFLQHRDGLLIFQGLSFSMLWQMLGFSVPMVGILGALGLVKMTLFLTLVAGTASLGRDYRDTQYVIGPVMIFMVLPLLLIQWILQHPNAAFTWAILVFPATTPDTAMTLYAARLIPTGWALAALVWAVFWTWMGVRVAAKLFRFGLLLYGGRPSMRQIWQVLWY